MDLNVAIQPFMFVSKLFGFAPYVLVVNKKSKSVYVKSKRSLVYCVVWFVGILVAVFFTLPTIFEERVKTMTIVMETTSKLQATCGIFIFIYSHLVCFLNRDKVLRIIARISRLGDVLNTSTSKYVAIRSFLTVEIFAVISLRFVLASFRAFGWNVLLTPDELIAFGVVFVIDVATGVVEMHFVNLVLVLNELYSALCVRLRKVPCCSASGETPRRCDSAPLVLADGVHRHYSDYTITHTQTHRKTTRRHRTVPVDPCSSGGDPFGGYDISLLHSRLHDVTLWVDSLFGFLNLLFVVNDFGSVLYALYFVFDFVLGLSKPGDTTKLWVLNVVLEATVRCLRLSLMVASCSLVTSNADQLACVVSKLQTMAKDAPMRRQMQTFSSQLVHRKIRFSAYGFLPIDATLISSIVGGVTTYLVIIIQFQMMTPPTSPSPQPMRNNT